MFLRAILLGLSMAGLTLAQSPLVISEFLASNSRGLVDADGDRPDWIEIQNTGTAPVNLLGWTLTDDPANPTKWRFPATNLNGGGFLVVFASGKDRAVAGSPLHANFSLSADGEYLGLFPPEARSAAIEFSPAFPAQKPDVSFGFRAGWALFFNPPTPGVANVGGFANWVDAPRFSQIRGFFETPFDLTLSSETAGAVLRYTTNGTWPTATTGLVYSGPVPIRGTTILRAAAFKEGLQPSLVKTHTYLFLKDVIRQSTNGVAPPGWPTSWGANTRDYGMDPDIVNSAAYRDQIIPALRSLPSFSVVTDLKHLFDPATGIYANPGQDGRDWERPCSLELVFPDGSKGFQIDAGIRIRGGFSRSTTNPKHALRFFFRESYGESKLKFPLFGNGGTDEFDALDLRTFQNYSWSFQGDSQGVFIRDQFSRDTQLAMGREGERGSYYHLYINGQYWGLYNSCERPEAAYAATYYGGDKEDYDVVKVEAGPYTINATDGTMDAWTRLYNAARAGLAENVAYFKLEGRNADGTPNPTSENLLDVDNLIDYMLVILYGGNLDAPISNFLGNTSPNNWYGQRDRTGRHGGFRFNTHDSEHTLLNVAENRTGPYGTATSWSLSKSNPQYLWQQLSANAEFRLRVADHVQKHFFNDGALTPSAARARFAARTNEIYSAVVAESARWGDSKVATPLNRDQHWLPRVRDILANYMGQRTANVLAQLRARNLYPPTVTPSYSQHGGTVAPGYRLAITAPAGEIRYTLDGSDPRQIGGAVGPSARLYSGDIVLDQSTTVRARVLNAGSWSALTEASFTLIQTFDTLRITEIHYHPSADGATDGDAFEFLELKNVGAASVDLSGVRCTDGIDHIFPTGTRLEPGRFLVLVSNAEAFARRYPGVPVAGVYGGRLSNGGERVALIHAAGAPLTEVAYGTETPWPPAADGQGFSLVPVDPNGAASSDARAWRTSARIGGSPGADDPVLSVPVIQISEILAHTDPPQMDAVELFNPGVAPVDVGGWYLSDDRSEPRKYRLPDGTRIPAGGYWVVDETRFNAASLGAKAFRLDSHGDSLWLHSADANGNLTGFSEGVTFGATANGVSLGRFTNSVGELQWWPSSADTLGAPNARPSVGPVILSEIDYQPAPGGVEFIELQNLSGAPLALFDPLYPTNTWRLSGVDFRFPPGTVIPAGGLLVVSAADPAWFRQRHGIPESVPVLGPWAGSLQDNGERIDLQRPDAPDLETNALGQITVRVPYLTVDTVRYDSKAPWPIAAAGQGHSLERRLPAVPADDPAQWIASPGEPLPGLSADSNRPPRVDAGPDQQFLAVTRFPQVVALEGVASDDGKPGTGLTYRWTQVGGPGPVSIIAPEQRTTQVRLPGQGTYSLRLTVSDGALSVSDDVVLIAVRSGSGVTWVPKGSTWRYLDTGVDPGPSWRAPGFDDSSWKSGKGILGYGDVGQATTLGFGGNADARYITTLFRLKFNVDDPASATDLLCQVLRDDGMVVWLNGVQAARDNLPEGELTFSTLASSAIGGTDETTYFDFRLDPGLLKAGENTLAVELHQNSRSSSDLSFDLSLTGTVLPPPPPPLVTLTIGEPPKGGWLAPSKIPLAAVVNLEDNIVSKVQFLADGKVLGESSDAPYGILWTNIASGVQAVLARVFYGLNQNLDSPVANVTNFAAVIHGAIDYYSSAGGGIAGVSIDLNGASSAISDKYGKYEICYLLGGNQSLALSLANDDPIANGITTADITLLRRHVLGLALLDSPYKILAADVNGSDSVTTADITMIRRLVLGVATNFPSGLWRFVPSDAVISDALKPWAASRMRQYATLAGGNLSGQDFKGIKLGDVNGSWKAPTVGGNSTVKSKASARVKVGKARVQPGEIVSIPVSVEGVQRLSSVQLTMVWDPQKASFAGVEGLALAGLSQENLGLGMINEGRLSLSWDDTAGNGIGLTGSGKLLTLKLKPQGVTGQRSDVGLAEAPTQLEVTEGGMEVPAEVEPGWFVIGTPGEENEETVSLKIVGLSAAGQPQLELRAAEGMKLSVETTVGLETWEEVQLVTGRGSGTSVKLILQSEPNILAKFWRVRVK